MEAEFIPYEQALALKELGFDEPCFGYFEPNKKFKYLNWETFKDFPYLAKNSEWQDLYGAPMFSLAFRWLLVLVNKDEHFSNKWTISYNEDYYSLFLGGCNMGVFKTELECLKKLIEIVKEK